MEKEALLKLNELVDKYARHRGYIERARSQVSKFKPGVVEKVIADHEARSHEVAAEILPLVPAIEGMIGAIESERAQIEADRASVQEQVEELELRLAIGELEEAEFESLTTEFRAAQGDADTRTAALVASRDELASALDRWVELASSAGQADGRGGRAPAPVAAPVAQAPVAQAPVVTAPVAAPVVAPVTQAPVTVAPVVVQGATSTGLPEDDSIVKHIREDVSEVYAATTTVMVDAPDENETAIEASDVVEEDASQDEPGDIFGFDEPAGGDELLMKAKGGDSEVDLVEDIETAVGGEEIAIDLETSGPAHVDMSSVQEENRRALLLYQEGTAEEQIYPFTGEVLTIGRGRDNDIQIKNDSKVSRFHCKLFRRGNNFYIEDNKSSNGTLVNGELITERRLFGGEEVIIGETFFRFRIL